MNIIILASLLFSLVQPGGSFKILSSTDKGLTASFILEELDTQTVTRNGRTFTLIRGGIAVTPEIGKPSLPYFVLRFALPPGAIPKVKIIPGKSRTIRIHHPVLPVPTYRDDGLTELYFPDSAFYSRDLFYPDRLYELRGPYYLRHQRYAEVIIYPIRFNPCKGLLYVAQELRIDVNYEDTGKREPIYKGPDPFEKLYSSMFVNYELGKKWRVKVTPPAKPEDPFSKAELWFKIKIVDDGLYKIDYNDLAAFGLPEHLSSNSFVLYSYGGDTLPSSVDSAYTTMKKVAMIIEDGGDGTFDGGDRIVFYGISLKRYRFTAGDFKFFEHPYSDTNVYWLGVTSTEYPELMEHRDVTPEVSAPTIERCNQFARHEENLSNIGRKGILWEGELIQRNMLESSKSTTITINVDRPASPNAELLVSLVGATDLSRSIKIEVNGLVVDSFIIYGITTRRTSCTINNLRQGANEIKITVLASAGNIDQVDKVYIDYIEIRYEQSLAYDGGKDNFYFDDIFDRGSKDPWGLYTLNFSGSIPTYFLDVTDPLKPVILEGIKQTDAGFNFSDTLFSGKHYFATNTLLSPADISLKSLRRLRSEIGGIDYVLITRRNLLGVARRLIDWKSSHLYLFDNTDSCFKMTGGIAKGFAIEDIYDEFGFGLQDPVAIRNFVKYLYDNGEHEPTYLVLLGDGTYDYKNRWKTGGNIVPPYEPWEITNVNTDIRGAYDDFYADMDGSGGNNAADIFIGRIPVRSASELADYIEKLILYESGEANGPWRNRIAFVADDEFTEGDNFEGFCHTRSCDDLYVNYTPSSVEPDHMYLIEIDRNERSTEGKERFIELFNRGSAILVGFMHGNPRQLTHEVIFLAPLDYPKINAGSKNPFVILGSCKVASFDRVEITRCIAEDWSLRPGAAIGVLASATLSQPGSNDAYFKNIFQNCVMTFETHPLGEMVLYGKNNKYYLLLGDPSIPFRIPPPSIGVTSPDTLITASRFNLCGTGFTGDRLSVRAFGVRKQLTYQSPTGSSFTYMGFPEMIFNGSVSVRADSFFAEFFVPTFADTGSGASVIIYDPSDLSGTVGSRTALFIVRNTNPPQDQHPPRIQVFINGNPVENGDTVNVPESISITGVISDEHGISLSDNLPGGEYGVSLILNSSDIRSLTRFFEYYTNTDTIGSFTYPLDLNGLETAKIDVKAYDNLNVPAVWSCVLNVTSTQKLQIERVLIYPNPLRKEEGTYITFSINKDARIKATIFTIAGRPIWQSDFLWFVAGENSIYWNGRDMDGDIPANGLYLVKLSAKSGREEDEVIEKILIAR